MKRFILLTVALALASCAHRPMISAMSPDAVTVRGDPLMVSTEEVQAKANEVCARYGKKAEFIDSEYVPLEHRYSHFACVQ